MGCTAGEEAPEQLAAESSAQFTVTVYLGLANEAVLTVWPTDVEIWDVNNPHEIEPAKSTNTGFGIKFQLKKLQNVQLAISVQNTIHMISSLLTR